MNDHLLPACMATRGATQVAKEFYPRKYGCPKREIFAYRYFNDQDREIGYLLSCNREYFFFNEPRHWADMYLKDLVWEVETHEHNFD